MAALLPLLALFIIWGATTKPHRPFSWGMYSTSTKGLLWAEDPDGPRPITPAQLGLTPDSHYLAPADLHRLTDQADDLPPIRGLIIGSQGDWAVTYDPGRPPAIVTPLPAGTAPARLAAAFRRIT
ncbi:hypothetical protein [Actinomadura macrotermitis]|uniref:Uncharacterized protein n=1 Tax=Actinomadura macrotermitis TaxID=2585200 RepID=A0A7K0BT15_9ACTN|nr:hypothetical protein [Actinomadura macrotermitis]MQY04338.1 hypothetical protein [Actinomadura macrotermitis]